MGENGNGFLLYDSPEMAEKVKRGDVITIPGTGTIRGEPLCVVETALPERVGPLHNDLRLVVNARFLGEKWGKPVYDPHASIMTFRLQPQMTHVIKETHGTYLHEVTVVGRLTDMSATTAAMCCQT